MKPLRSIEEAIRSKLNAAAGAALHDRVLARIRQAQSQSDEIPPALTELVARRMLMRSPILRLTGAAVVIAVVGLGIIEFVTTGTKSSVVWAEVAQKVQASRGLIYRERGETAGDYVITYLSPTQYRSDGFKEGKLSMTMWDNLESGKQVVLLHFQKGYVLEDKVMRDSRRHANYQDPRWWVQKFLGCKYTKLGPKEIDGTLCEGIETTDPALIADYRSEYILDSLTARLWVSTVTRYPVLFEGDFHCHVVEGETSRPHNNILIIDQFQWDVELDASVFEPKIPPDYEQM
jgi:hypothetical protein